MEWGDRWACHLLRSIGSALGPLALVRKGEVGWLAFVAQAEQLLVGGSQSFHFLMASEE